MSKKIKNDRCADSERPNGSASRARVAELARDQLDDQSIYVDLKDLKTSKEYDDSAERDREYFSMNGSTVLLASILRGNEQAGLVERIESFATPQSRVNRATTAVQIIAKYYILPRFGMTAYPKSR